jgi:FtsP/CotA-like multicopper oxidase with cupredoxin domain
MKRRTFLELGAAAPLVPLLGCGGGGSPTDPTDTPGTVPTGAELSELPRLANAGGNPRVFEASLNAAQGQTQFIPGVNTQVWSYNGATPGPLIDVFEGDTVRITFNNNLAQDSTIHWHGVPVPPSQDGLPMDPIPPGAARVYQFPVPRGSAGTFWYHPHPHVNSAEQVFRGLAGMFIIRAGQDPLGVFEQKNLFITDLRLDAQGQIPASTDQERIAGREGNHLLVNGREFPRITIRPGTIQRWRIVNATTSRFLRLALQNHSLVQVGTDGGLLQAPIIRGEIFLSPAERAEVLVVANQGPGASAQLVALPYDPQRIGAPGASAQVAVATLAYTMDPPVATPRIPNALRQISRYGTPNVRRAVLFQFNGSNQFLVNGKVFDPNRVDIRSSVGQLEEWEVTNLAGMDHPFHIHQGQFQIVNRTRGGVTTSEPLAWKDTFNMAPGEIVRFRMVFPRKGLNVFHCHIVEHEAHGMMGVHEIR